MARNTVDTGTTIIAGSIVSTPLREMNEDIAINISTRRHHAAAAAHGGIAVGRNASQKSV